jgi:hypothetical protein
LYLAAGQASPFDHDDGSSWLEAAAIAARDCLQSLACSLLELVDLGELGLIGGLVVVFGTPKSVIFGETELSSCSGIIDKSRCHKLATSWPRTLHRSSTMLIRPRFLMTAKCMLSGRRAQLNPELEASEQEFRALFGIGPDVCGHVWTHLSCHKPPKTRPKHLLWTLLFLKVNGTETALSVIARTS